MNRTTLFPLALVVSYFFATSLDAFERVPQLSSPKKELTFLVYIAGVNNLADYVQQDIDEMQNVGSSEYLNILAYVNTIEDNINVTRRLFIEKGKTTQIGDDEARDSGDPQTLIDACAWAHQDFPSNHFILVLWDHGSGSVNRSTPMSRSWLWGSASMSACQDTQRAVCFDDITGNFLTDAKLMHALSTVCTEHRQGKKIDIVAFDACLMANAEVAFALAPFTKYMVASQDYIPGIGFGYDHILRSLAQKKMRPFNIARLMTSAYKIEYTNHEREFTLSALDLSWLDPVVKNIDQVGQLLTDLLNYATYGSAVHLAIKKSASSGYCTQFSDYAYLDLAQFYQNLIANIEKVTLPDNQKKEQLLAALSAGLQHLRNCVIANVHGPAYKATSGLSLYFMRKNIDPTYESLYWSQKTQWLAFLTAYEKKQDMLASILPLDFVF